jgi:hypothetical protein
MSKFKFNLAKLNQLDRYNDFLNKDKSSIDEGIHKISMNFTK